MASALGGPNFVMPSSLTLDTGISVDGGDGGKTLLCIASTNSGSGNNTTSQIDMIRCGYSGHNISVTNIAKQTGASQENLVTYTVSSNGTLVLNGNINSKVRVISN